MAHRKTAVSIEEGLFEEAEAWAGKLGISRSKLFSEAVAEYVRKHENEELLSRLNEAYADEPDEEGREFLQQYKRYYLDRFGADE